MKSSKAIVESYLKKSDWRVKENSNAPYCYGGLNKYIGAEVSKDYWLREVYPEEIAQAYVDGHIHIHDLGGLTIYCCGYSLKDILYKGVKGVPNIPSSAPAKHFDSILNQCANLVTVFQNEIMGAVAFNGFDTLLAPFIKKDNLSYEEVKQSMQNFIFSVNSNSRAGAEPAFFNLTFDLTPPEDMLNEYCVIGGDLVSFTYGSCQQEIDMLNRVFFEVMLEGDSNGKLFAYPIPTYNIHNRFDWDNPNNKLLWEMAGKYGTPYFANFVNSDLDISDVRSMCIFGDSLVWCKLNGKTRHITIEELFESTEYSKQILTKYGYRDIKELQKFNYCGDVLKFKTETGKELISTIDHEHIVFNKDVIDNKNRKWITDGSIKKWIDKYENIPEGFTEIHSKLNDNARNLIKKKAYEVNVGDYFSCRAKNFGENNKNKTYEEIYGNEKAKELHELYSNMRKGHTAWNKGLAVSQDTREKISKSLKGHYVSENCKNKSSARWSNLNNPIHSQDYWTKNHISSCLTSPFEFNFMEELDALGYEINKDYIHQYCVDKYICDFYIPSKNLIIELETNFLGCSYNDNNYRFAKDNDSLIEKYNYIKYKGYNLLIFNPKDGSDVYRQFINSCEKIVSIEQYPFDGYVYDLEVDCDDLNIEDTTMYHSFYANEILTGNCCRLRLDLSELRHRNGGLFGAGDSTGSIGVVTLNLPRIGYETKGDIDKFYKMLDYYLVLAKDSLEIKRKWLQENVIDTNFIPAYMEYVGTLRNHFSTIGIVGMNEMCENFMGKNILDDEAHKFCHDVGEYIRNKLLVFQEETGNLYNYEATPAESTCYRFALNDKKYYPEIITQGSGKNVYYTNSCHIPVSLVKDIDSTFAHQDDLQTQFTGGTVIHCWLEGAIPGEHAKKIVKEMFSRYRVPYMSLSPISRYCDEHGYIKEHVDKCPYCKQKLKMYQRITGYLRCIDNFNPGKFAEFKDRNQLCE